MLGVQTHVLRYWESELPQIQPVRAPSGHRLYHRSHIEMMAAVQHLVHREGLTIAGARKRLEQGPNYPTGGNGSGQAPASPGQLAAELRDILKLLA